MKTSAGTWFICCLVLLLVYDVTSLTFNQILVDSRIPVHYDPDPNNMLGANNWPQTYKKHCRGYFQSPVDIKTDNVRYGALFHCPRMIHKPGNINNKALNPERSPSYMLTNVPRRPGLYFMNDLHLHYGGLTRGKRFRRRRFTRVGSEHTFDGHRYDGELHFVFYNSKYRNVQEARNKKDGVVVIAILVQITGNSGKTSRFSKFLQRNIPPTFPYHKNVSTQVDASMFFTGQCEFYTYSGSMTTPMCQETVRWIILRRPISVTAREWFDLISRVSAGYINARFGTTRPTQPLYGRVVEANFMRSHKPMLPMPSGRVFKLIAKLTSANMPRTGGERSALVRKSNRNSKIHAVRSGRRGFRHSYVPSSKQRLHGSARRAKNRISQSRKTTNFGSPFRRPRRKFSPKRLRRVRPRRND